ncbi:transglutaminase domain-containing protein [Lachnospiraceae bacterium C1.1]|nr:transglutaminase-like domain-containing protein [Lachnospiraceae bacterium C1.1]
MNNFFKAITATILIAAITTVPVFAATPAAAEKADQIVSEIIRPGMTDAQKVQACNDYLIKNLSYDYSFTNCTADSALTNGSATPEGYADSFKLLMDACSIPCQIVKNADLDHTWNRVYIKGVPYEVDVSMNDSSESNDFTLITAEEFFQNLLYCVDVHSYVDKT